MTEKINIIVGAGMTGLTAGCLLAKDGERCLIVERNDDPGGLCRTFTLDDVIFDLGPHLFFHDPSQEAENFVMDAISDLDLIHRKFRFAVNVNSRSFGFPLSILDILFYPWVYKKEMVMSLFKMAKPLECDERSAERVLAEKSGKTYYSDLFAGDALQKVVNCRRRAPPRLDSAG